MLDYKFGPKNTYMVAVTYGPESTALLDMMLKSDVKPVVCFVNYRLGDLINEAEAKLKQYCKEKGLILEIGDAKDVDVQGKDTDFEKWSRDVRYSFFEKFYKKHRVASLFLAHTQDDIIESYLLTKRFGGKMSLRGLNKVSSYHGMIIVCPLLDYSSEDILEYVALNNVLCSRDIKKYETSEFRSEIRRDIVEKLNEVERDQILSEINKEYDDKISFAKAIDKSISTSGNLNIREIMALSEDEFAQAIMDFVNKKASEHCTITPKLLASIRKMCLDPNPNLFHRIHGSVYIVKEYDELTIDNNGLNLPYSYVIKKPGKFSCPIFDLDFSMGAEDRNIHDFDYPVTIRSLLPSDVSTYGGYLVPAKKMLSAGGISERLLHVWPVFLNKDGKIIYIPRYKKGFSEYHSSIFAIHVKDDEK
jgi:tRNA(Ile)-lysidine synthase